LPYHRRASSGKGFRNRMLDLLKQLHSRLRSEVSTAEMPLNRVDKSGARTPRVIDPWQNS
ncbi:MAG: hypothetical protein WCA48_29100, partial [Pseudomonas gingeri]